MHRKHPLVRRSTFFAFLFIGLTLILKPHHAALSQTDGNLSAALADPLQIAVKDAIVTMKGTHPEDAISLFDVQSLETGTATWAAGSAMVYAVGDSEESSPYLFPFVAYWDQSQWQVAVEYAPNYAELLKAAPPAILSPVHLAGLATPGLAMPSQTLDAPQLGLPWALGETQYLTGGPHSDAAFKRQRPWSAIDFAGGSYHVRAAADGVVYLMPGCPYVQINHGNGWQTGYYHLTQIAVKNGQTITRGTLLGRQSLAATCGGQATGTHMHMTLRLNGQFQNWHGQAIGGWRIEEGASPYDGCLLRAGLKRCAITAIYNDGAIGEGDGNVPALPATPTHTPRPTSSPLPRTPTPRPTLRSTTVARTPIPRASQTPGIIVTPATPNPFDLATLPETDGVCGLTTIRLNAKIPDNTPKLSCFSIPITATGVISELAVAVAMSHTWVSDLRMQLRGPSGQILTLLNRPGWPTHAFGYGSNLSALYPITFTKRGAYDAEQMGSPDTRRVICHDDQQCEFAPNADQDKSVTTVDLEALTGSPSNGNWQVCMSDSAKGDIGMVASIGLDLHCAAAPETTHEDLCAPVSVAPDQMIPDNNSSGVCVDVTIPVTGTVDNIALALGLDHTYLGDVRAQLISPNQMTLTLMDRPGQPAARYGDTSNLVSAFPITFADDAPNDSEQMGQQLGGNGIVCRDDLRCRYRPNADGTPNTQPSSLHDLAGQNSAGVWRVCVSDLSAKDVGRLHQVTLDLTCSAPQAATPDTLPTPQPIATTVGPASTLTPEPTATAADDPGEGMLKAEELDELAPNVVWLPALTR